MNLNIKITRRKAIKWAALTGAVTILGVNGKKIISARRKHSNKNAEREEERPNNANHWFTPQEYAIVSALIAIIIPSEKDGSGAADANVADNLDRLVTKSEYRQVLYKKGLQGFNEKALDEYGSIFAELTHEQQIGLLELVDRANEDVNSSGNSLLEKINLKLNYYKYIKWHGLGTPMELFPILVEDVKQSFYTSETAWDWLGYDGPPQPYGYIGQITDCEYS